MHNWAGVGWRRRPTDHNLLILAQASRFKDVYSSIIFKNMFKPLNSIHFYICLNEIEWQFNWAFNRKLTCWGIKLVSLKRPDLNFVIHRNNTTEKVFVGTIFIFPVHDTIFLSLPREGHAVSLNTPKSPTPKKIQVSKISNPTKSFDHSRHLQSLAPRRGHE